MAIQTSPSISPWASYHSATRPLSAAKAAEAVIVCASALAFALMVLASVAVYVPVITGQGLASHDILSFWSAG
jgi:hypothetical protein